MQPRVVDVTLARAGWADLLNRVLYAGERILLSRRGQLVAAIIPAGELELLDRLADQRDIETARRVLGSERPVPTKPWNDVKRFWGLEE